MWVRVPPNPIMNQIEYAKYDRETWQQLKKLSQENKLLEFYKLYLDYLTKSGILSESRMTLYDVTLKTIQELEK